MGTRKRVEKKGKGRAREKERGKRRDENQTSAPNCPKSKKKKKKVFRISSRCFGDVADVCPLGLTMLVTLLSIVHEMLI